MLNIYDESRPSRVTVAFEDRALSFMLSKDATFGDLADRLDRRGEWHHGKPIAIEVKFAAAFDAQRRRLISGLGRGIGTRRTKRDVQCELGSGAKASSINAVAAGDRGIQSTVPRSRSRGSSLARRSRCSQP